jgi:hypothetical protein
VLICHFISVKPDQIFVHNQILSLLNQSSGGGLPPLPGFDPAPRPSKLRAERQRNVREESHLDCLYSTWSSRPSCDKVFTPRSYSVLHASGTQPRQRSTTPAAGSNRGFKEETKFWNFTEGDGRAYATSWETLCGGCWLNRAGTPRRHITLRLALLSLFDGGFLSFLRTKLKGRRNRGRKRGSERGAAGREAGCARRTAGDPTMKRRTLSVRVSSRFTGLGTRARRVSWWRHWNFLFHR